MQNPPDGHLGAFSIARYCAGDVAGRRPPGAISSRDRPAADLAVSVPNHEGDSEGTAFEDEDQDDIGSEGDEGARNADATPKLDEGGETGQTQSPAPDDDVGVPDDSGEDKT